MLALLRHDGDTNTVRALCEAEIPDFLKEDSSVFVQDVFDAIHYKTYLPGAAPPPRRASLPFAPPTGPSAPMYGNIGLIGAPLGPQNGSRKRSYNDRGDGDAQDRGYQAGGDINTRLYKQPRRGGNFGGPAGRGNFNHGRGGFQGQSSPMNLQSLLPQGFMPGMPSPPPGMPPLDPNNPMAAILAMQAMGFPVPGMPSVPPLNSPGNRGPPVQAMPPKKQRCRDYDLKGFCARGNTCMFEHGQDSIYVPPVGAGDEYDPTSSSLMTGIEDSNGSSPNLSNFRSNDRGRGRGSLKGDRGGQLNTPSRRGGRAEFSSDRPNFDRTKTTIVVENIPEERFEEDQVRAFFSEFGEVVEISMRPYKRLAIVKFEDWNAAKAAYSSPKVIFDNRFVKVYWYTDPESLPQPPAVSTSAVPNGSANGNGTPTPARATSESQIDIEEFTKKQKEVQKVHEEKMKKKQEMEAARKELEKRQEELLKNQAEEKRKLMERIAAKAGKSATPTGSDGGTSAPSDTKSTSQTEALKAQLAALEAEARSLGIDTSLTDDSWSSRGRGRGRGGFRGRGPFVPRGYRGGYRGRGVAPLAPGGNPYKLDNRPKKVGLTGVDFSNPEHDESLRQYLLVSLHASFLLTSSNIRQGIGEYSDIEVTPTRTVIAFKDRFTAEKFMYGIPGGEIPSVGKVELTWIQTSLPPVNLATKNLTRNENFDDAAMDDGDAMAHTSSPALGGHGHDHQESIDYDVADDNEWGIQ